jgi:hypothetical protein
VIKVEINGEIYLKTKEEIVLNKDTYEVVGILIDGKIKVE